MDRKCFLINILILFSVSLSAFPCGSPVGKKTSVSQDVKPIKSIKSPRGRFGIRASEKLGCGMSAIARFEFRPDNTKKSKIKKK